MATRSKFEAEPIEVQPLPVLKPFFDLAVWGCPMPAARPVPDTQYHKARSLQNKGKYNCCMKEKLTLFLVALVILWGQHPGFSESQQIKKLRQAAEQGDTETQFRLGRMYSFGRGVSQDEEQAAKWYRCAAEQGNSRAQFMLGEMYAGGQGTPEDHVRAYA